MPLAEKLLMLLVFTIRVKALSLICYPGEENSSQNMTALVYTDLNATFRWQKNSSTIATCSKNSTSLQYDCEIVDNNYTVYVVNDTMRILRILQITRDSIGTYTLLPTINYVNGMRISCVFQVYARPEHMSCIVMNYPDEYLTLSCSVSRSFPEPICQFYRTLNTIQKILTEQIYYANSNTTEGNDIYYNTNCSITLQAQSLGFGAHLFGTAAYPNVTGLASDIVYGINSTVVPVVNISFPTVALEDCVDNYYLENAKITCTCREVSNSFLKAKVKVFNDAFLLSEGRAFTEFNLIATRHLRAVSCQASLLNFSSVPVNITLNIAYGPESVIIKVTQNGTNITTINLCDRTQPVTLDISCSVPENSVSPKAMLDIYVNGTKQATAINRISIRISAANSGPLNLTCLGRNTIFPQVNMSSQVQVIITEPPSHPVIYIVQPGSAQNFFTNVMTFPEGFITIGCRADGGFPLALGISIQCGTRPPYISVGNLATVNINVSRYSVTCSCEASLVSPCYWKNTAVVALNVTFVPRIISMKINNKEENITVGINSLVKFSCEAEGNPSPTLVITRNNYFLGNFTNPDQKFNLTLEIIKNLTDCTDTGLYVCQAGESWRSLNVYVKCIQKLTHQDGQDIAYVARLNSSLLINIPIIGFPAPIKLELIGVTASINARSYTLMYISQDPPYGTVQLVFFTVSEHNFQNYILFINNTEGSSRINFQVKKEEAPPYSSCKSTDNVGVIAGSFFGGVAATVVIGTIIHLVFRKGIFNSRKEDTLASGSVVKTTARTQYEDTQYENAVNTLDPINDTLAASQYEEIVNLESKPHRSSVKYVNLKTSGTTDAAKAVYENTVPAF